MVVPISAWPRFVFVLSSALALHTAWAADSPVNGKALFENTASASGHAGVQSCPACHGNVENRRTAIDPGGDLDFDLVFAHFTNAIATQGAMAQFNVLTTQQKRDIAAYIADVPKARPNFVDFSASAVNTETAPVLITFANAVTATSALTIDSVGITGASSDFVIKTTGTTCANNLSVAAGSSCTVNVSFKTSTGTAKTGLLNIAYTQSATSVTRTAQLNGTVAGQPPPSSAPVGGGGGGALPAGLLVLLLGTLVLRRLR